MIDIASLDAGPVNHRRADEDKWPSVHVPMEGADDHILSTADVERWIAISQEPRLSLLRAMRDKQTLVIAIRPDRLPIFWRCSVEIRRVIVIVQARLGHATLSAFNWSLIESFAKEAEDIFFESVANAAQRGTALELATISNSALVFQVYLHSQNEWLRKVDRIVPITKYVEVLSPVPPGAWRGKWLVNRDAEQI